MNDNPAKRPAWTKPELTRLGEIKDVAGKQTPSSQGTQGKS
jgi:hypothetical protein